MRPDIAAALAEGGGVASLSELGKAVPLRSIRRAVARGELVRILPCVYAAEDLDPAARRLVGVVRSTGGALSHRSALETWQLIDPSDEVHVTIGADRRVRSRPGIVVHRATPMPTTVIRAGLPVINLDRALVDSWAMLPPAARRGTVIGAVRRLLTTPARVRTSLAARSACRGARELRLLLDLLERGCHSELEIWGLQRVLVLPGLPRPRHQILVRQDGRRAYLDSGWEAIKLGVEFDGAQFHSGAHQRERDLRRDARLASHGWLILRFSYQRLMSDPEGVRAEIRAAYEVRLLQFGAA